MTGFDGETVYIVGDMVWRWDEYGGLWRSFISGKRIDRRIDPLADEAIMSRRTVEDKTDNGFCPMWVVLLYNFSKSDPLDLVHAGEAVVLYDIDTTLFWPKRIWIEAVGVLRRQFSHGRNHHGTLWLMSVPALSANGSMYIEKMTFVHLLSGTVATLLAIRLFLALMREHRYEIQTKRQVIIGYQGNEFCVQGFLDTGNRLMDPETGLPVCLISPQLWSSLMGEKEPVRWITYRGATGFEGLLAIMEPDRIQIGETNGMRTCETVLGTGLRMEGNRQWDGCHILLNGCFAEGCIGFGGENVS